MCPAQLLKALPQLQCVVIPDARALLLASYLPPALRELHLLRARLPHFRPPRLLLRGCGGQEEPTLGERCPALELLSASSPDAPDNFDAAGAVLSCLCFSSLHCLSPSLCVWLCRSRSRSRPALTCHTRVHQPMI